MILQQDLSSGRRVQKITVSDRLNSRMNFSGNMDISPINSKDMTTITDTKMIITTFLLTTSMWHGLMLIRTGISSAVKMKISIPA